MGINLVAFFSPLLCGTLGQKVGWHWGFGAAGVGMLLGLLLYWLGSGLFLQGQQAQAGMKVMPVERPKAEPLNNEAWRAIIILTLIALFNMIFWAVYEEQG